MRILTLEEMELVAGGGGSRPKNAKRAPDRKSTRLNSSYHRLSRMPSSA